jgi:hypothetical protein
MTETARAAAPQIRHCVVLPRVTTVPGEELISPASVRSPGATKPVAGRALAVPAGRTARRPRRARTALLVAAGAAVLIAVPLLLVTVPGRPDHDTVSSAANQRSGATNPGAPAPNWPGGVPPASPPVSSGPPASPSASAKPSESGTPGAKPGKHGKGSDGKPASGGGSSGGSSGGSRSSSSSDHTAAAPVSSARSLRSHASNRCASVSAHKAKDGSPLQIANCGGNSWQKWTFKSDGSVRSMGMCMDVAWGSSDNGTTIQLARCNGGSAQRFDLNGSGDLVNLGSYKCVDVKDKKTAGGTPLQLWECGGTSNQKWSAV